MIQQRIKQLLNQHKQQRISRAITYPQLRSAFIILKRIQKKRQDRNKDFACEKWSYLQYNNVRHQSLLMRRLGDSDPQLQRNKITNIQLAIKKLDGLIIYPEQVFSFRKSVQKPTEKKGYLEGILINHGWVDKGIGGWLCQLSNLLYRMFLHLDVQIKERHRHSYDIFPDSGRVLPFASGATIFYNYVDLQIKNTLSYPIQLKLWTTDTHLKWCIMSNHTKASRFHLYEKHHTFIKHQGDYFRYNQIRREKIRDGISQQKEMIIENFSPVKYNVDENKLDTLGYTLTKI